jgi:hypothetical protein
LETEEIRLISIAGQWTMPTFGAPAFRDDLLAVRDRGEQLRYKELFANSVERSAQRSRS